MIWDVLSMNLEYSGVAVGRGWWASQDDLGCTEYELRSSSR